MSFLKYGITDLHLHLDGSLSPETVLDLAKLQSIELPADTREGLYSYLTAPAGCEDLNDYLKCFELPLQILQTGEALSISAYRLTEELADRGIRYAEIRYAPQLHTRTGLRQADSVLSVLEGVKKAVKMADKKGKNIRVQIILCCMRGIGNTEANLETVYIAEKYLGRGVAALDLAGAEGVFPTSDYEEIFRLAGELKIPFTIHAGEAAGPESIWKALEFGASRIGHGVRASEDRELVEELRRRRIPLEMCPVSNQQTKTVKDFSKYPLKSYLERGLMVTVNSDNMTVSDTWAGAGYEFLRRQCGLTREEAERLSLNGVEAAFLSENEKAALRKSILAEIR